MHRTTCTNRCVGHAERWFYLELVELADEDLHTSGRGQVSHPRARVYIGRTSELPRSVHLAQGSQRDRITRVTPDSARAFNA